MPLSFLWQWAHMVTMALAQHSWSLFLIETRHFFWRRTLSKFLRPTERFCRRLPRVGMVITDKRTSNPCCGSKDSLEFNLSANDCNRVSRRRERSKNSRTSKLTLWNATANPCTCKEKLTLSWGCTFSRCSSRSMATRKASVRSHPMSSVSRGSRNCRKVARNDWPCTTLRHLHR